MSTCGIYEIKNIIDGKVYVGSSKNIEKRFAGHKKALNRGDHHNLKLQRAWDKFGEDAFIFRIILECSIDELLLVEQTFIDANVSGYNMAPANGGDILSSHPDKEDIIARRSQTMKHTMESMTPDERKLKYGKYGSSNGNWRGGGTYAICMSCGESKITVTAKTCSKCRDRSGENNSFYGKQHSDATKERLRQAKIDNGTWVQNCTPEEIPYTKLYEVIMPSGEIQRIYGLKAIANMFNVTTACIGLIVGRGRPNTVGKLKGISILEIKRPSEQ